MLWSYPKAALPYYRANCLLRHCMCVCASFLLSSQLRRNHILDYCGLFWWCVKWVQDCEEDNKLCILKWWMKKEGKNKGTKGNTWKIWVKKNQTWKVQLLSCEYKCSNSSGKAETRFMNTRKPHTPEPLPSFQCAFDKRSAVIWAEQTKVFHPYLIVWWCLSFGRQKHGNTNNLMNLWEETFSII